jgi:hypothetical protein
MIEPKVEIGIVSLILNESTGMSDSGAVAVKLTPQPIWARYIATWRANAVRALLRVGPRNSVDTDFEHRGNRQLHRGHDEPN